MGVGPDGAQPPATQLVLGRLACRHLGSNQGPTACEAAALPLSYGGVVVVLPRQDSNLNQLSQNQRCCRLHHEALPRTVAGPWCVCADVELPRQDSNLDQLNQTQPCYRVTPRGIGWSPGPYTWIRRRSSPTALTLVVTARSTSFTYAA